MPASTTDVLTDLALRLALVAAAVVLAVTGTGPAEAVWGLLGALVPTPAPRRRADDRRTP